MQSPRMVGTSQAFETVQGLAPISTPHNLSYQLTTTGNMGKLMPLYYEICQPGDKLNLGAQLVIQMLPTVGNLFHEINAEVFYFACPIRLLWQGEKNYNAWETWLTGSIKGMEFGRYKEMRPESTDEMPNIDDVKWNPFEKYLPDGTKEESTTVAIGADIGTIWESIGLPYKDQMKNKPNKNNQPLNFVKLAYNLVYNEWFRDENLRVYVSELNDTILNVNWKRDYLTSASYEQQKGTAPAIPIQGIAPVTFTMNNGVQYPGVDNINNTAYGNNTTGGNSLLGVTDESGTYPYVNEGVGIQPAGNNSRQGYITANGHLQQTSGIKVADLRHLIALQRILELDMRAGTRYSEYIQANFDVKPEDARMQIPEFIGRDRVGVQINQVVQTGGTTEDSVQGNQTANPTAISNRGPKHTYYAKEHCVILGLVVVAPKPQYQQKIPRKLMKSDKYDWYRPQLAYLSEQEVLSSEVFYDGDDEKDMKVFGFQGRWDEMRTNENVVTGLMRADVNANLSYMNMARYFDNRPNLNQEFIECIPRGDAFVFTDEPQMLITIGWECYAMRKIPATSEPGMLDHVYGENNNNRNVMPRHGRNF